MAMRWLAAILLCSFPVLTGCAVPVAVAASAGLAAAQAGSAAWVNGELREAFYADLETVHAAVHCAMEDVEAEVIIDRLDERSAYIMAKEPRGPELRISMTRRTPQITRVGVRISMLGDLATSKIIVQRIAAHLPQPGFHSDVSKLHTTSGVSESIH